jgi:hypothetical protein
MASGSFLIVCRQIPEYPGMKAGLWKNLDSHSPICLQIARLLPKPGEQVCIFLMPSLCLADCCHCHCLLFNGCLAALQVNIFVCHVSRITRV